MGSLNEALKIAELLRQKKAENKLRDYVPIEQQKKFLDCKLKKKGLVAANRTGKSLTLMVEVTYHLTGRYPAWWTGVRFNRPIKMWLVGMSMPMVRDTLQRELFGPVAAIGTGLIPKYCIGDDSLVKKAGVPNAIDIAYINHISGGKSEIKFFSGDQDRKDFQGAAIDLVAFDEEPKKDIHDECMIRLATTDGYALYSFTPLSGQTDVVNSLMSDPRAAIFSLSMDECPWLTQEIIERLLHGMSDMEKRARRYGIPATGSGQIFQFEESEYTCNSFEIPDHWPRIGGLDIGYNHPTGAVALAWDRDSDCLYVYQEYKAKEKSAVEVARTIRHWGIQFSTSHDAFNKSFQRGECTADIFKDEGLFCFSAGRDPWARIEKVRTMISSGRLYIFKDRCPELVKEMRTYHTRTSEAGKITIYKVNEDLIDAFTHAVSEYEKAALKGSLGKQRPNFVIKQYEPPRNKYGI